MAASLRTDPDLGKEFGFESDDCESTPRQPKPSQVTPSLQGDDNNDDSEVIQYSGSKRSSSAVPSLACKELFPQQAVEEVDVSEEEEEDSDPPKKRLCAFPPGPGQEDLVLQQEEEKVPDYSQLSPTQSQILSQESSTADGGEAESGECFFLKDTHPKSQCFPLDMHQQKNDKATNKRHNVSFTFGRDNDNTVVCPSKFIGRKQHAQLVYNPMTRSFTLATDKENTCFVLNGSTWDKVSPESSYPVVVGGVFRLLHPKNKNNIAPPDDDDGPPPPCVQFTLCQVNPVGAFSFDLQYLTLLRQLEINGKKQTNKKGENVTLADSFQLKLDLCCENKNLLPLSTLRNMFQGRAAVIEALWYLRGEDHIRFLQDFQQKFWDKQANLDGSVGFNYGLLTNFDGVNQLKKNVIDRLVVGGGAAVQNESESSRNMVCSLVHPNKKTVQSACTTSVQFSVTNDEDDKEYLNLTVVQRSSDVILGLPHDVVVWTVILHLVRQEVDRIIGRKLRAGKLYFNIAAGGAHYYTLNQDAFHTLLSRRPKPPNIEPELIMCIDKSVDMFEFAKTYKKSDARGYGKELMGDKNSFDKMYPVLPPATSRDSSNTEQEKKRQMFVAGYSDCHPKINIEQAG